jgi:gliding motility-associated-like protein
MKQLHASILSLFFLLFVTLLSTNTATAQAPQITTFVPISTVPGATLTITGTGFSTTPANNVVFFGATQATVTGASATSLAVVVPSGATHAPITVLNTETHLGAYSPKLFLPVFSPGKASITAADLEPGVTLPAGTQPRAVAIADLNADGKPELIVVNQGSRFISVFKNSGAAGTLVLDTKIDFLVGLAPLSIKIADIDGDGRPDLVVANGGSMSATVLLNTSTAGSISFAARVDFSVTASHVGMGIGDLDGDGKPDLVVPNNNLDIITILRNTSSPGVASFAAPITIAAGNYPSLVEVNDLDGDGKADLAVTNTNSNDLSVFRNTSTLGLITFGTPINLATGTTPYGLSSGDLNGDGRIDLAVANTASATISVFVNTSLPGVMAFAGKADFATAVDPFSVAIADINGDGRPELVSANRSSDNITVLRNTGTFASFPRLDFATGSNPQGLAMGDLDADGRPEVVVTDYQANTISVFQNNAFTLDITSVSPSKNDQNAPRASNVVVTFNRPLTNDAASLGAIKVFSAQRGGLLSTGGGTATINTNTLTFNPATDFKPGETIQATITKAVNSNGDNPVRAQVFRFTAAAGTGPGTFLTGSTFPVATGPAVLATGDVDGDGDLDAIASSPGSAGASVRLNDGTGHFSGTGLVAGGAGSRQIELADLDGDGDLDMVMANETSTPNPTVSVRFNNGTGVFSGGTDYPLSILAISLTIGDVDGDGDLDLLVGDQAAVWMRLNNGSGSFAAGIAISGGVTSNALLLDIDNDSDLDLAFTGGPTLFVRFNNGDGTFATTTASYSSRNGGLVAGDVDGDGDIDLINYQYGAAINNLLLFRNDGTGVLTSNLLPIAPTSLTQLAFGDIDGDGDLDLLGSEAGTGGFIVMRNSGTGTFTASASYGAKGTSLAMGDLDGDGDLDALFSDEAGGSGTTVQVLLNQDPPEITALSPARNENNAPRASNVSATFNKPLINNPATQGAIKVFSAQRGGLLNTGGGSAAVSTNTLTFNPATDFKPGELIQTTITTAASGANENLPKPHVYQFRSAAGTGTGIFKVASTFSVATGPFTAQAADVDGDGDLDAVTAGSSAASASIRFNNGSGVFSGTTDVPLPGAPLAVSLADVDGDGDLDLISANSGSLPTAVSVRFNNGTGTFGGGANYTMASFAYDVALGDVDGDGDLDLVTSTTNSINIKLNNGNGNFSGGSDVVNPSNAVVILTDMDGDGDLDLTASTQSGQLIVSFNNGIGVFAGTTSYPNANGYHLDAGDVDNDGDVDLITSEPGAGIFLFRNDGTGVLARTNLGSSPGNAVGVKVGDIDGDGDLDILTGTFDATNAFAVLRNNGTGTFGTPERFGNRGMVVNTGDLDNDGDLDILHADLNGGNGTIVSVLLNVSGNADLANLTLSSGTLSPAFASASTSYTAAVGNATTSVTLTPTTSDATATVTVNGTTVASGSASAAIPLAVGSNTITTVVTAQDGTTTKTYTTTVTRAAAANADLAALVLSSGTLSPIFAPSTTSYTASVGNAITSITLTPTVSDPTSTVRVNGITVASGSASATIPLAVGSNTITTVVTAQDGTTTKTYTVTVTRAASANADLSSLTLSSGTLSPVFAPATTSYTASVSNATTSITLSPTVSDATATITVNGATVVSGSPSAAIPLAVGSNTITTVVTAQDGTTTKTYTVTVTMAASANADLSALTLSAGTLSPVFAPGTASYTASVGNATTNITLTPTVSDATATITVNGTTVASGSPSASIPLAVGSNTITTVVTAQDGTTTKTYTVTVTRAASANADLSALTLSAGTLSPVFAPGTASYTASVGNATTNITLTPTVSDATATITVNGTTVASGSPSASIPLAVGSNTITTVVTAQNGTTKIYTVTVTRAASANADLASLVLSSGTLTPAFAPTTTSYTASVGNATTSITLTPTVSDATATVTINGATVASGSPSASIPLAVGSNTITTVVTAQNGTTKIYTVTVTRAIGTQTITFSPTSTKIYGDEPYDPGATSNNSAVHITYTSSNTAVATVSNGMIQIVAAGNTTITAAQAGNANYAPASADQVLTVQPKTLTITANERTKVYGQSLPSSTTTTTAFTVTGLAGQETVSQVTISYGAGAPASAVVNTYTGSVVPSAAIGSNGFVNANYSISYIVNNLLVTRAALNIAAGNRTKTYGDEVVFAGNEFTSTGLVNGNSVSSVTLNSTGAVSTAAVTGSPYAIVPSSAVGSGLENYTINYANGSLTVNRKALFITADHKNRPYGLPNPPLTASYQGFITGENSSVLTTPPAISTTATASSPVGDYPITASGATSANYLISYANGVLTITASAPTDIVLTAETLYENRPLGTLTGSLSSTAVDPSATYTYTLVAGSGSADNAAFSISGNRLLTAQAFDYESRSTYSIRIRTANNQNQSFEKAFTIVVADVNEAPTLAVIADLSTCFNTSPQTTQLSGISAGPEATQTFSASVNAANMNMFDQLTVTMGTGGAATLNYRLKGNVSGSTVITVTVKDNGGTANGGTDTYSRTFTLNVLPLPSLSIVASQGTTISKGTTQTLTASGASGYVWSNATGIIDGQNTASLTVRPTETTTYTVTGTNASGCTISQSIIINVLVDYNLVANNVLTPNGDGINDVLFIQNIDVYPTNVIKIFDRGGRLLYTKNGYRNEWDGTINGTALTEDTYYYIIELSKGIAPKKGFITVVRRK